jgi:two-component system, NarL family, response regulator DevR
VKIIVVDPHPIMLAGLRSVLESDAGIELIASCGTGRQALDIFADARPELIIADVDLPDTSGADFIRAIKRSKPEVAVLVLTACHDNATVFGAIAAGASGYVLKDITPENLLRAIHAVGRGQTMVNPGIARRVFDRLSLITQQANGKLLFDQELTQRESEILVHVGKGLSNKEIARKLFISESTVKSRLRNIFTKIGAHDRAHAAAIAIREGYMR